MAPKNAIPPPLRKAIRSTSQGSTTASVTSSGVMIRSMPKAIAVIVIKQSVGNVPPQARKMRSLVSNMSKGVNKITLYPLKQTSVTGFKMHQTIP